MSQARLFVTNRIGDHRRSFETRMRGLLLVLPLLFGQLPAAQAQVSVGVGIDMPGVSIGINLPTFPHLQQVPGYPVYYAPDAPGNYFYYDGLYWVFQGDDWYASAWYNGPWQRVMPVYVPAYVLRVPVYYYRLPPPYFRYWRADAPPRWDQHWGPAWQQRRPGWNHWDRHAVPPPAPLPTYQRRYPQSRYPQESDRQQAIRAENFNYRPHDPVSRQAYQLPDRPSPHLQGRPVQRTPDSRPSAQQPPRQQDRSPAAVQPADRPSAQAAPQDRGHPQGRTEPPKTRQVRKGDDPSPDRSPPHPQGRPVQSTESRPAPVPRAQPSPQSRPQPQAQQAQRPQDRPQGRAQTPNQRQDKQG